MFDKLPSIKVDLYHSQKNQEWHKAGLSIWLMVSIFYNFLLTFKLYVTELDIWQLIHEPK